MMPTIKQVIRAAIPRGIRNWLRSPRKSVLWGWHEVRYLLGATSIIAIRPDWSLRCHPIVYPHSYYYHQIDPEQSAEFDGFVACCTPGMILFDLGAHFGLFSLAALHYGGPTSRALAVDASPTATRIVQIQASLNGIADRLQVVRACVSDQPGVFGMVAAGVLSEGFFVVPGENHTTGEVTQVPAITLDQLAEQFGAHPTHVKIDVEGFEGRVLQGGRSVLSDDKAPLLFLELHNEMIRNRGENPEHIITSLEELGYTAFTTLGERASRENLLQQPLVRTVFVKQSCTACLPWKNNR